MTRATAQTRIREITTESAWDEAVPLLRQLWSDADEAFVRSWADEDGYRLFGLYEDDELVAVAGVSIQRVLHPVRQARIHDFVVDEDRRGEGLGADLLAFVEEWARERDCEYVALACTLENEDALAFYEREEVDRWGYVLEREL